MPDQPTKPYLSAVASNFKGGVAVQFTGHVTVLAGPCGSGKSAIVNSIEWAIAGAVTNVSQRTRTQSCDRLADRLWDGPEPVVDLLWSDAVRHADVWLAYHEAVSHFAGGVHAGAAWLADVRTELKSVRSADRPTKRVAQLDAARQVLGEWFAKVGEDTDFFAWYADLREQATREVELAGRREAANRRQTKTRAKRAGGTLAREASQFVPGRFGNVCIEVADQLRVGLQRHGEPIRWSLSGGEEVMALTAVAVALCRARPAGVVMPPDVGMDPATFADWVGCFTGVDWCSIVLTTTTQIVPGSFPDRSRSFPQVPNY